MKKEPKGSSRADQILRNLDELVAAEDTEDIRTVDALSSEIERQIIIELNEYEGRIRTDAMEGRAAPKAGARRTCGVTDKQAAETEARASIIREVGDLPPANGATPKEMRRQTEEMLRRKEEIMKDPARLQLAKDMYPANIRMMDELKGRGR